MMESIGDFDIMIELNHPNGLSKPVFSILGQGRSNAYFIRRCMYIFGVYFPYCWWYRIRNAILSHLSIILMACLSLIFHFSSRSRSQAPAHQILELDFHHRYSNRIESLQSDCTHRNMSTNFEFRSSSKSWCHKSFDPTYPYLLIGIEWGLGIMIVLDSPNCSGLIFFDLCWVSNSLAPEWV